MSGEVFEAWGVVELMGHLRIAGRISEQLIAGVMLLRIDVPATDRCAEFTRYFGASAIYSLTPTSEAVAVRVARLIQSIPVSAFDLRTDPVPAIGHDRHDAWDDDDEGELETQLENELST